MSNVLHFRRRPAGRPWLHDPAPRRARWRRRPRWADPRTRLALVCAASLLGLAVLEWDAAGPAMAWLFPAPGGVAASASPAFSGRVVRVIDGDSFRMDCCGPDIRLWGIDAPEWDTRGGPAATAALRSIIAGRSLTCRQRAVDRYGRIVGQCTLPDGTDLGRRLLRTASVREYCHFSGNYYRTC